MIPCKFTATTKVKKYYYSIYTEKMKIYLISDLHLEFYKSVHSLWRHIRFPQVTDDDVLILAGDIGYGLNHRSNVNTNLRDLLLMFRSKWKHVIYVSGNHEYYPLQRNSYDHDFMDYILRDMCKQVGIHFLQKGSVIIDGVRFMGCTLWSEIQPRAFDAMNDGKVFNYDIDKYRGIHYEHKTWLRKELPQSDLPTIVVSHHLPSNDMIHPKYQADIHRVTNSAYASNLNAIIGANKDIIKLWCCGHTHEYNHVDVEGVPIICNPFGYPGEKRVTKVTWEPIAEIKDSRHWKTNVLCD
jgi:Icc-related predicted phosphoesterase